MKIKLLNKIAKVGTDAFDPAVYEVSDAVSGADAILVRSASMHDMEFEPELLAIARAGAGVTNIPTDKCAEEGIVVFNTPGANANGVKELALCALFLASRNVVGGANWAQTLTADVAKQVEKGKSAFAGCEIAGKTLGVIGLGAIGRLVANAAVSLGMKVVGCDPFLSKEAAKLLDPAVVTVATFDEVYAAADYLTLHVPATKDTKNMICAASLAKMKKGVRILNLARADLVSAADLKAAIAEGKVAAYVTDFPTEEVLGVEGILAIPHLGASTEESEDNCAQMAGAQTVDFLENGNIKNSVNYPAVNMGVKMGFRVCVCHKNVPNVIATLSGLVSAEGVNIDHLASGSRGEYAYTILELNAPLSDAGVAKMREADGVIRVRTIA